MEILLIEVLGRPRLRCYYTHISGYARLHSTSIEAITRPMIWTVFTVSRENVKQSIMASHSSHFLLPILFKLVENLVLINFRACVQVVFGKFLSITSCDFGRKEISCPPWRPILRWQDNFRWHQKAESPQSTPARSIWADDGDALDRPTTWTWSRT
jgi:hypothetical protein